MNELNNYLPEDLGNLIGEYSHNLNEVMDKSLENIVLCPICKHTYLTGHKHVYMCHICMSMFSVCEVVKGQSRKAKRVLSTQTNAGITIYY